MKINKYIRTKEGIIVDTTRYKNVVESTFNDKVVAIDLNYWGRDNDKYPTWIKAEDIVKQADTVKELGDTYVIVPKDRQCKPYTVNTLSVFDDFRDVLEYSDIYLSVWVDALLKPIAQLNDNGELKLL